MSQGLNVNNQNQIPYQQNISAGTANTASNMQNSTPKMQGQLPQDVYQFQNQNSNDSKQNKPVNKSKLLIGAAVLGAGALITLIAFKIKGKKPSVKEAKAATEGVSAALNETANKTDGASSTPATTADSTKPSFCKKMKDKFQSFKEDVKTGYDEHIPVPESQPAPVKPQSPKPKKEKFYEKISRIITSFESEMPAVSKITDSAQEFAEVNLKAGDAAFDVLNDNAKLDNWVQKAIADYSSETNPIRKRSGFGMVNRFFKTGNNNDWVYIEGCPKKVSKDKMKSKRSIVSTNDNIFVKIKNYINKKKNIETSDELFKYNKASGKVEYHKGYKVTSDGIEYSKGIFTENGASTYNQYIEGYKSFKDGTIKIVRGCDNPANGVPGRIYEGSICTPDGKKSISKLADFDANGMKLYAEDFVQNADGSIESLKYLDIEGNSSSYFESFKKGSGGTEEAQKKIKFINSTNPAYCMEGYKKSATGEISADIRIEYEYSTGKPKYYYEGYKYNPSTSKETYNIKAEFKNDKWVKI